LFEEPQELIAAVPGVAGVGDFARGDLQGSEQGGGAVPDVVLGALPGMSGLLGSISWIRSNAWIWLFALQHKTTALSGAAR
jgi:hypothetical protein